MTNDNQRRSNVVSFRGRLRSEGPPPTDLPPPTRLDIVESVFDTLMQQLGIDEEKMNASPRAARTATLIHDQVAELVSDCLAARGQGVRISLQETEDRFRDLSQSLEKAVGLKMIAEGPGPHTLNELFHQSYRIVTTAFGLETTRQR